MYRVLIVVVLLVVFGARFAYVFFAGEGPKLDAESKAYAQATLPRILPNMSSENFLPLMAQEDRAKLNAEANDQFARKMRDKLGRFQSCGGLTGEANINVGLTANEISATYKARCKFEKGAVTAMIISKKTAANWSLWSVRVDDKSFEAAAPNASAQADAAPAPAASLAKPASLRTLLARGRSF